MYDVRYNYYSYDTTTSTHMGAYDVADMPIHSHTHTHETHNVQHTHSPETPTISTTNTTKVYIIQYVRCGVCWAVCR